MSATGFIIENPAKNESLNYGGPIRSPPPIIDTTTTQNTKETSTVVSNCTVDPAADHAFDERRKHAEEDLSGRWMDCPDLIDRFFPPMDFSTGLFKKFRDSVMAKHYSNNRWKDIPLAEKEEVTNAKFLGLLNAIRNKFKKPRDRLFKDAHSTPTPLANGSLNRSLRPDVFFSGTGKDTLFLGPQPDSSSKVADWKSCIVIFEGKVNQNRQRSKDHFQLAAYIREVFSAQDNRRFIPGFIFTQTILKLYVFDRSGVVYSEDLDYHANPDRFLHIIAELFIMHPHRLGFDESIYYEDGRKCIITYERADGSKTRIPQKYFVDGTLFKSTALVGDCTTCWRVTKEGGPDNKYYLIKDAWVVGGSKHEGTLLDRVLSSGLEGVAPIVSHENVKIRSTRRNFGDCVAKNRRAYCGASDSGENRVHTRIVMALFGKAKALENYSSVIELITAFRDAVAGHRNLYEEGRLHRDVTSFNMLIQPGAPVGSRGVLFDLRCAVTTEFRPRPHDTLEMLFPIAHADRLGSRAFQAFRILATLQDDPHQACKHWYIHDLESFYYTLCYVFFSKQVPRPEFITEWFRGTIYSKLALTYRDKLPVSVPSYLGDRAATLLQEIHVFIGDLIAKNRSPSWTPLGMEDYKVFLKFFNDAITGLALDGTDRKRGTGVEEGMDVPARAKRMRTAA